MYEQAGTVQIIRVDQSRRETGVPVKTVDLKLENGCCSRDAAVYTSKLSQI